MHCCVKWSEVGAHGSTGQLMIFGPHQRFGETIQPGYPFGQTMHGLKLNSQWSHRFCLGRPCMFWLGRPSIWVNALRVKASCFRRFYRRPMYIRVWYVSTDFIGMVLTGHQRVIHDVNTSDEVCAFGVFDMYIRGV
jgi:hypothetical protein